MSGTIKTKKVDKTKPRKAWPSISYRPKNKKAKIKKAKINDYLESFTYVDAASGESDTVSFTLSNIGLTFAKKWLPKKGDTVYATIIADNWDKTGKETRMSCGRFCCDDRNFSFPQNLTATIGGVSVPENHSFRSTPRTKTWENISLKEVARQICARYGLKLAFYGEYIPLKKQEQSDADDCSFLNGLCKNYGYNMKVYDGKVILYDIYRFEKKKAVATIAYREVTDGDYSSTLIGTYTGAKIKYTVHISKDKTEDRELVIGNWARMLVVGEKADSYDDALRIAKAKLREENRKAETLKITIPAAGRKLWAATNIRLTGAGIMSGKWFVDKATHSISATDGYTVSLELHRAKGK